MKKLLVSLLVLACVAPALADVAITATDEGDGQLKISILPSGGAVVRGVALKLSNTDGAVIDAVADVVATQFNTFIDYAYSNPVGYDVGEGDPIADPDGPGVATLPAGTFSLSAGYLDQGGDQGGVEVESFFDVFFDITVDSTIDIELDTLRGGVVGDNLGTVTVQPSQLLAAGGCNCMGDINADGLVDLFNDLYTGLIALDNNGYDDIIPCPVELVCMDMNGDNVFDLFNDLYTVLVKLDENAYNDLTCPVVY